MSTESGTSPPSRKRNRIDTRALREHYYSGDTIWTLLLFLLSLFWLWTAVNIDGQEAHDLLGARFFPILNAGLLLTATTVILVTPFIKMVVIKRAHEDLLSPEALVAAGTDEETVTSRAAGGILTYPTVRGVLMVAVCTVYVVLMPIIGYIASTILGMAGALYIFGLRKLRSLILIPGVTALLFWYVFSTFLFVRFP